MFDKGALKRTGAGAGAGGSFRNVARRLVDKQEREALVLG